MNRSSAPDGLSIAKQSAMLERLRRHSVNDGSNSGLALPPRLAGRVARQSPVAEKCMRSMGDCQVPPQVQPMPANALVTTSPGRIMPGRSRSRSR